MGCDNYECKKLCEMNKTARCIYRKNFSELCSKRQKTVFILTEVGPIG